MPRLDTDQLAHLDAAAAAADGVERCTRIAIKKRRVSAQDYVRLLELGRSVVHHLEQVDDDDDDDDDGG